MRELGADDSFWRVEEDAYIMTIAFGSQKPHMYLTEECIEYLRAREWVDMSITDQTLTLSQAVFDLY